MASCSSDEEDAAAAAAFFGSTAAATDTVTATTDDDSWIAAHSAPEKAAGRGQDEETEWDGEPVERTDLTGDPGFREHLAYADYVQSNWALETAGYWLQHRAPDDETPARYVDVFLLTGEAGCGKSVALRRLYAHMCQLKCHAATAFCATTHNAKELLPLTANPSTYHSAFGIDAGLIGVEDVRAFCRRYAEKYEPVARLWLQMSDPRSAHNKHCKACAFFSTRCYRCVYTMEQALQMRCGGARVPRVVCASLIVIDEYGMLSKNDLDKVLFVLNFFRPPSTRSDKRVLVLSGSVSQLSTAPEPQGVWHHAVFRSPALVWTTCLTVNRRMASDAELERALSFMQYNVITEEAERLFASRVVGPARCTDCSFVPNATRIFNNNADKARYNEAVARSRGELRLRRGIVQRRLPSKGTTLESFYQTLKRRHPKIFWERTWNPARTHSVVARGAPAVWKEESGESTLVLPLEYDEKTGALTVENYKEPEACRVSARTFELDGYQAVFVPVYSTAGINTFCAQGATLSTGVVYCPPRHYHMSPIKASAYVAMSRVPHRELLWLSCNPFHKGLYSFFSQANVHFRQTVELGYDRRREPPASTEDEEEEKSGRSRGLPPPPQ